jgi:predicted nucleic acid-binding protein
VTVVVLDASAAAELVTRTALGRRLRKLAPSDAAWWAPDHLYVEAGAAVRKMRLRGLISVERADAAIAQLLALPVTVVRSKPLVPEAWAMRENVTVADAVYVVLARHLDGPLLTGDRRLARAPKLGITVLHLSGAVEG